MPKERRDIVPIEVGEDYRDFLASSVMDYLGARIVDISVDNAGRMDIIGQEGDKYVTFPFQLYPIVPFSGILPLCDDVRFRLRRGTTMAVWLEIYYQGETKVSLLY